ncbi:MAG: hypothetical protein Q7V16_13360, partial [Hydrogenophaga sp.]|nr:hypothetical protein [Hydrogenophaga sp.]
MNTLHRVKGPSTQHAGLVRKSAVAVALAAFFWGVAAQTAPTVPAPTAQATPGSSEVVNSALNAPLFYQLLLGELNVRAGEPGTGYSFILDAARKQRDPLLYRR